MPVAASGFSALQTGQGYSFTATGWRNPLLFDVIPNIVGVQPAG